MDATGANRTDLDGTATDAAPQHDIPLPPTATPLAAPTSPPVIGPYVANPFVYEAPVLAPGQLAPGWRSLFVAGWFGVLVGFGCVWQAARVAGIAPWWLGPETNPRSFVLIALPFLAPFAAGLAGLAGARWAVYVGLVAGVISLLIPLGDLDRSPGLAAGQAVIAAAGLLVTIACFAGRMRRPRNEPSGPTESI